MKKLLVVLIILIISFPVFSQEFIKEKDGALLWADNCMGCHIPQNFLAAVPSMEYVDEIVQTIDYNIYDPESGMNFLSFLKTDEIERIAHFLIYKSHGNDWIHSEGVSLYGTDNCLKCHDNERLYKEPPKSCNVCH